MTINELPIILKAADLANDSVIIEAVHGVGKSDAVKQFARENNYYCQELFLSMMDISDLMGMPRTRLVGSSTITTWAEPDWFQRITDSAFPQLNRISELVITDSIFKEYVKAQRVATSTTSDTITRNELNSLYSAFYDLPDDRLHVVQRDSTVHNTKGQRAVLFLDELNRSNLDVRQAALQLVLNKELHNHKLPYINGKCTVITAAINPADLYQVDELDAALLDRFLHVELKPDTKEWLSWARSANVNQMVCDFLAEKPNSLHWSPKDGGIGATPRSWAKLASFIDVLDTLPKEVHFTIMKGKIGSELAGQFLSFYNNYSKVVKVEDIEAIVAKQIKKTTNPEVIAKAIAKVIDKQESIQKNQLAEILYEKYIKNNDSTDALTSMPCIAFLYAIEIENLASFLKQRKEADHSDYMKLANFDKDLNQKGLFTRITTKLK